jgi:lipid-A-disaccharide synthase
VAKRPENLYAGALVRAMRAIDPRVSAFGFGGAQLQAAGAELVGDYRGLSVTGLVEAIRMIPPSLRMLRTLRHEAATRRPAVFVAIDFPISTSDCCRPCGIWGSRSSITSAPQLWAWRSGRIHTIKQFVDRMLVIFPFEAAIYEKAHVPVEFVGHPLVDLAVARRDRSAVLTGAGLRVDQPVVALLPGSRANELREILPTLVDAAILMARERPGLQFLVARAPALADRFLRPAWTGSPACRMRCSKEKPTRFLVPQTSS